MYDSHSTSKLWNYVLNKFSILLNHDVITIDIVISVYDITAKMRLTDTP